MIIARRRSMSNSRWSTISPMSVPALAGGKVSVVIWTTTPWTLPANLAVAFHPDFVYAAVAVGEEVWMLAEDLVRRGHGRGRYRRVRRHGHLFRRKS